jgi:hypothetical protein
MPVRREAIPVQAVEMLAEVIWAGLFVTVGILAAQEVTRPE